MKRTFTFLLLLISGISFSQVRIYPLDGNAVDIVNALNGTLGTGIHEPIVTTDRFNNPNGALLFDGDAYIQIPTLGIKNDTFSVSAWITVANYPTFPSDQDFFSVGDAVADQALGVADDNFGQGLFFAGWTTGNEYQLFQQGVLPAISSWHHVAGVYSPLIAKFYVDGIVRDSFITAGAIPEYGTSTTAFIGCRETSISFWHGKIDDLRIYNRALTNAEVSSIASGIEEPASHSNLFLFPNPVHDHLIIDGSNLKGTATLFNMAGEKIKTVEIKNEKIDLSLTDIASGIYLINYFDDKKSFSTKFIKE